MKRILIALILIAFVITGCEVGNSQSEPKIENVNYPSKSGAASAGVWLSFSEIRQMLAKAEGFKNEVLSVADNCNKLKVQNIYIHVRSHCDSIFESDYFPLAEAAASYDYDVFEYMINTFHSKGIKVHAWINPYRVSTASADVNSVRADSPIHNWLKDENTENDRNVCIYNGVYLNPAESEVQQLVINGIRELVSKYNIDGIHFDDYFYPTTAQEFDFASYESYKSSTKKPLSIGDWRRANVNLLISGSYSAIKHLNEKIVFSVSPAASIDKNYNEMYADVEYWIKNGMVDCIIPQLYFGFNYPQKEYRFDKLLNAWKRLAVKNENVELIIGLASYKIGTDSAPDSEEWQRDNDIIARQVELCAEDNVAAGYVFFSYSSLVSGNEPNIKERENYLKYIN